MTVKLRYTRTVIQKVPVDVEIPSEFVHDETARGKVVDIILKRLKYIDDPEELRLDIFADDAERGQRAISALREAYDIADEVISAMSACQ